MTTARLSETVDTSQVMGILDTIHDCIDTVYQYPNKKDLYIDTVRKSIRSLMQRVDETPANEYGWTIQTKKECLPSEESASEHHSNNAALDDNIKKARKNSWEALRQSLIGVPESKELPVKSLQADSTSEDYNFSTNDVWIFDLIQKNHFLRIRLFNHSILFPITKELMDLFIDQAGLQFSRTQPKAKNILIDIVRNQEVDNGALLNYLKDKNKIISFIEFDLDAIEKEFSIPKVPASSSTTKVTAELKKAIEPEIEVMLPEAIEKDTTSQGDSKEVKSESKESTLDEKNATNTTDDIELYGSYGNTYHRWVKNLEEKKLDEIIHRMELGHLFKNPYQIIHFFKEVEGTKGGDKDIYDLIKEANSDKMRGMDYIKEKTQYVESLNAKIGTIRQLLHKNKKLYLHQAMKEYKNSTLPIDKVYAKKYLEWYMCDALENKDFDEVLRLMTKENVIVYDNEDFKTKFKSLSKSVSSEELEKLKNIHKENLQHINAVKEAIAKKAAAEAQTSVSSATMTMR